MTRFDELIKGYELRRIVFKEVTNGNATIIPIGMAKAVRIAARLNRMKRFGDFSKANIIEIMKWSRKEIMGTAF